MIIHIFRWTIFGTKWYQSSYKSVKNTKFQKIKSHINQWTFKHFIENRSLKKCRLFYRVYIFNEVIKD